MKVEWNLLMEGIMNKIDNSISITCKSIDDNINVFNNDRGLLSQNILSQLRNLV